MKRKKWEQLVENKKNDSVVKVTTIQEEYKDGDKVVCIYDYETEEYFKNKRS
jgi:ribosomal protein L21E